MARPERRTLRGPYVVLAFVLLATAGVVGGWLILREHPTPTRIIDVRNLDGDHAIVVREVEGPDKRSFISLYARERGEVWGALIPEYAGRGGSHSTVAATRDVVFVRGTSNGQAAFFAFRNDSGQKLGRIEPYLDTREPMVSGFVVPTVGSLFGGGEDIEISGVAGAWTSVLAFGLEDGTLRWQLDLDDAAIERGWLEPGHLLLRTDEQVLVIGRERGVLLARIQTAGPACVTQDTLYTADGGRFLARPLAAPQRARDSAIEGQQLVGLCGTTPSHTLVAVARADGAALVALDEHERTSWQLSLPGDWLLDEVARHMPARSPLGADAISRFAPVVVRPRDSAPILSMLDTGAGRIAYRSRPWEELADASLMTAGTLHHLYLNGSRILATFDGDTGELVAARALEGWDPVWPRHIAGGRIWITSDDGWAVLDARTLAALPGANRTDAGRDVLAQMKRRLIP